jgi:uncharacterized repeat protein (TIGR01451 family)
MDGKMSRLLRISSRLVVVLVVSLQFLLFLSPRPAEAAVVAGFSEYYIPGFSDDLMAILDDIEIKQAVGDELTNLITISVGGDVTLYYDHWENGLGSTTTADETYTASKGDVLTFKTTNVPYPRDGGGGANVDDCTGGSTYPSGGTGGSADNCYDGRDRIYVAGGAVSVAQAFWPTVLNTNFANAWEIYPVKPYQTSYTIPVGEDLYGSGSFADFYEVFVMVQATADDTGIEIDDPGSAGVEVDVTRDKGETVRLDHIDAGTLITATAPVQVQFLIGEDLVIQLQNNSRSYTAVPSGLWSTEYYSPVPGASGGYDTDLFVYNPTGSALTIDYEDRLGSGSFSVAANATESYQQNVGRYVPTDSAVYLAAADGTTEFWAIGGADAGSPTYNWGFTLLPPDSLTDEYFLSWAPGGWNQGTQQPQQADYSPIYVTPIQDNTTIFVDYSPVDGTADATYVLDRIEMQKIYDDSDADNTGHHIWATGPIAVTWGEDADTASVASPGLDAGYTILPLNKTWIDVVLDLEKTADPSIIADAAGQTSVFTLVVSTGAYTVTDVVATDTLPANWSYVSGSTMITLPDDSTITGTSADPDTSGQDLIWDELPTDPLDMLPYETLTIEFTAITTAAPGQASLNEAETSGTFGSYTLTADDTAMVDISALEIAKISSAGGSVAPGDTITYTILITNTGTATQNNIVVSDTLPVGTTYVPSSTLVTYPTSGSSGTYADDFDPNGDFTGSDGTSAWNTNWLEVTESDGAAAGDIQVGTTVGGCDGECLELWTYVGVGDGAERSADLAGASSALLEFDISVLGSQPAEFTVQFDGDGAGTYTNGPTFDEIDTGSQTIEITDYITPTATTYVRFLITTGGGYRRFGIDNVVITPTVSGGDITVSGGSSPNLVTASDGIDLPAGETMTVTWKVTVDDPVPAGQASVVNIVAVSSDEEPAPLEDTVVDVLPFATIGNTVWLDEDGDGDQDAGEVGIPNAVVELYNANGTLVMTTTTDANGGYLFDDVVIGTYTVTAKTLTMPSGLAANPTYDEDDGTTSPDSETVVTLTTADEERMTADFGYNWASPTDTNTPGVGATGAIGDRVWIDADGDGAQNPGELGMGGVTVRLYTDPDGDGVYDSLAGTTTTDDAGNYIFDDLTAGAYVVEVNGGSVPGGYTQTGDPDQFGLACTACDNETTLPVVLAPGDVFVNADFGYEPDTAADYQIGNQVFLDANGDGNLDTGEPGIANVTVALLDASGDIIATTRTDANGVYTFTGLVDGTYTIWVNDTDNVLGELVQNSKPNNSVDGGQLCSACDGKNTVTLSGSGNLYQDFGYAPPDHVDGDGLIGDFIFLDANGDDSYDPGEPGLEGVTVTLTNSDGNTKTTTTDENGYYSFGNLPAGTYTVTVSVPSGLTNSVDPYGSDDGQSVVTIGAGGVNLDQDFGYKAPTPNTISGTIWEDTDADGTLEAVTETNRFAGVTVVMYDGDGNVVATTETDSSGNYSFTGLPDGTYTVDVTDEDNVLNGYWHSTGSSPGSDNNSQVAPYTVSVSGGQTNTTADFGYYVDPAAIGNFVWLDLDNDGVQDADEPGIEGVTVVLTITYPTNGVVTVTVVTGDNGAYSFGNLLLDEDHDIGDSASGTPTYEVGVGILPGTSYSPESAAGNDDQDDGDSDGASEIATVAQGEADPSYDFGFLGNVDLGDLPDDIGGSPDYPTWFSPGPAHVVFPDGGDADSDPDTTNSIPAVWLGSTVDTESNGQPSTTATGDDISGNDEDGVAFVSQDWVADTDTTFTVTLNSSESGVTVYYGLWIDWDADGSFATGDFYSGSGVTGSPITVTVPISVPVGYTAGDLVYIRARASDAPLRSGDYQGTLVNGEVEDYRDNYPTAVTLSLFQAEWNEGEVLVTWETAMEIDTVGFNLWRSTSPGGRYERVNSALIPAESLGGVMGGFYFYTDPNVEVGTVYYYKLEELEIGGRRNWYGPVSTGGGDPTSATFFNVAASDSALTAWWVTGAVVVVSLPLVMGIRLWKRRR